MLVFSLRRGESFFVADQKIMLLDFDGERAVLKTRGKRFDCPNELVQLPGRPDTQVSAGLRQEHAVRIAIKAPLEVKVLRERLYHRSRRGQALDVPRKPNRHYARAMGCRACRGIMHVRMHDKTWVPCPALQNPALGICEPDD